MALISPPNQFGAQEHEVILAKPITFRDVRSEGEKSFVREN